MNNYVEARDNYINYKFGNLSIVMADKMVEVEILSLLDRLSFPMNDVNSYLYKDLVFEVANKLKMVDKYGDSSCLELIAELSNSDSQFYGDFANSCCMSLDELHFRINSVISKIDVSKMDEGLLASVCEEYSFDLNYGELAFILASMILGFKREKRNNLIRIRSL